uniref:Uncharacterized protein n=1 Tax=Arundo donax TaxID=35708 RepID=A0A0A8ZC29_ARUDO
MEVSIKYRRITQDLIMNFSQG